MNIILVVEDDTLLGKTVCKYLDKAGYEVFWAKSSEEAYEALEAQDVQLVFLDIMMPGVDGYSVLREIRASEKNKTLPVVMLSNLSSSSDMEKAMNLGATDYIVKSNIDLNDLVEKVRTEYLV